MTVRWKPLLVLSGLFLVIAVVGVIAIAYTLMPRGANDILPQAREARNAKRYDEALIHYQRALQPNPRNAEIHEEVASLYEEWLKQGASLPAEQKTKLEVGRIQSLVAAADFDKRLKEPRRKLLEEAIQSGARPESLKRAKELLDLEPTNTEARYVLASEELENAKPDLPEVKRHIAELIKAKIAPVRLTWLNARIAQLNHDAPSKEAALKESRSLTLPEDANTLDRTALLRLRELDLLETTDTKELPARVQALQVELRNQMNAGLLSPNRLARLSALLENVQKNLLQVAAKSDEKTRTEMLALVEGIDKDVEVLFQKALAPENQPELQVYLSYAEHLRFRAKRDACIELVEKALKLPLASRAANADIVLGLHTIAVEVALGNVEDETRFERSAPHITKLIECSLPAYQGLGHLFQGSIELEKSGVSAVKGEKTPMTAPNPEQIKLRASALNHLKIAAVQLPDFAEAQARYGVALVLSMEPGLGRQYLQQAMNMGTLEPQYQIWAAWSMVQAGYPEEAEPIVSSLMAEVSQGRLPTELEGTLRLLNGEVYQARRNPEDLEKAKAEYEKSFAGKTPTPAIQLRLAQIDVQLGRYDEGLKRIEELRKQGEGGPAAEHLAVLTLREQDRNDEARKVLDAARKQFPESEELVSLDASMLSKEEKHQEANDILAAYLEKHPDQIGLTLLRAQILDEGLKKQDEARKLLTSVAERSDNSQPLVQLALMELKNHDHAAVASLIAKIRSRWKEAAIADLLDAQLSLDQNDLTAAAAHYAEALKKDPSNKMVQYWKAQLDSRTGSTQEARDSLEQLAQTDSSKEVEAGIPLGMAAESSLASLALAAGDPDSAIKRLEQLRSKGPGGGGGLSREDRWQLVAAYSTKGLWPQAKREIAQLLNDKKSPPTFDERVRGANFYRVHDEDEPALAQLDYVIKVDPTHPPAVVSRAYILARAHNYDDAKKLLKTAIEKTVKEKPPAVFFFMLAAVESTAPPQSDALQRTMVAIEDGLKVQPDSEELVNAKYRMLRTLKGDKEALAYVEAKAEEGPKPIFRRMLVEVYRKHDDLAGAERVLRQLLADSPKDSIVAANLVRIIALQALQASEQNQPKEERALNDKVAELIREFRTRFPADLEFLQAECDLAGRKGDLARATAITHEMDKISKTSPKGPIMRARIYAMQGRLRESAEAYEEALERNPRQFDVRLWLGQARLKLNEHSEAIRQAKLILEIDNDQPDALLLAARATASQPGTDAQIAANRAEAIQSLTNAIKKNPKLAEAYHEKSEIELLLKDRKKAIATLEESVKTNDFDAAGLALLIQRLSEPREDGKPAIKEDLAQRTSSPIASAVRTRRGT